MKEDVLVFADMLRHTAKTYICAGVSSDAIIKACDIIENQHRRIQELESQAKNSNATLNSEQLPALTTKTIRIY